MLNPLCSFYKYIHGVATQNCEPACSVRPLRCSNKTPFYMGVMERRKLKAEKLLSTSLFVSFLVCSFESEEVWRKRLYTRSKSKQPQAKVVDLC